MGLRQLAIMVALLVLFGASGHPGVLARQGTPAPALPAATPTSSMSGTPAATPAAPAATIEPAPPAAPAEETPAAPADDAAATTNVVTLVAWYETDPSGEFLNILPIAIDPALVAEQAPNAQPVGEADFPEDGPPTISLGETMFISYPRGEGDIPERWTWFDDFEGARPATLVLQVEGQGGAYAGYYGTVTFVSRDEGGVGGVIIFALRPPGAEPAEPEADTTADAAESEPAA